MSILNTFGAASDPWHLRIKNKVSSTVCSSSYVHKMASTHKMNVKRARSIVLGAIIFGTCVLWQLFLMKQIFLEKERYQVVAHNSIYAHGGERQDQNGREYSRNPEKKVSLGLEMTGESDFSQIPPKNIENENESDQNAEKSSTDTLLDLSLIRNTLLREAPWAESHGANHLTFLGAGMLYYSMAYAFRSKTIVVLGSGGGFVPRILRQAQRDLLSAGIRPDRKAKKKNGQIDNSIPSYDLYLVDAHLASAGWGSTFYAENENTTMRKEFSDIHYVFQLTDDAFTNYFRPMYDDPNSDFKIDYLHVDADHGFEQSWKDFDNYSKLLSDRAVISFHDTCYDNVTRSCHSKGVPETIEKLRNESQKRGLQVIDLHYLYRGIAFAFREHAMALEAPSDHRINFCVNNADLINVTSDGFTKNGRVGSLPTLGDFMECSTRYNVTELIAAKSKMLKASDSPNGIMAVPCPIEGFRRNSVSGKCDKCIPGLIGDRCQRSKYEAVRGMRDSDSIGEENAFEGDYQDLFHLTEAWLRSSSSTFKSSETSKSSLPRSVIELGANAWNIPTLNNDVEHSTTSSLLFGSSISSPSSYSTLTNTDHIGDIMVVDPILVTKPMWIDLVVSRKYRFLPCTLKDAVDFDERERNRNDVSKSSSLDLDTVDTLVCLTCDEILSTRWSSTMTKEFFQSTFPSLQTIILGIESNEASNKFLTDFADDVIHNDEIDSQSPLSTPIWRLDRDVTMSLGGGSQMRRRKTANKRLVLFTRTNERVVSK